MHRSPASSLRRLLAATTLALSAHVAHGEPATLWQCWLEDHATTLACAQEGSIIEAIFDDPVLQHGVTDDGVPDRRAILKAGSVTAALRAQPMPVSARPVVWRTPLFSPAYDDDFTALLARAVMCGRQAGCQARFRPAPGTLEARSDQDALQLAATR